LALQRLEQAKRFFEATLFIKSHHFIEVPVRRTTPQRLGAFAHAGLEIQMLRLLFRGHRSPLLRGAERIGEIEKLFRAQVQSLEHWGALESQRVLPRLGQALQALDRHLTGDLGELWHTWRARYVPEVQKALAELRRRAAEKSRARSAQLEAVIDPLLPPERRKESLSRKALWVVASTPGVSSVLAGLRDPDYVRDALAVLSWPPLGDPAAVFRAVRERGPRP